MKNLLWLKFLKQNTIRDLLLYMLKYTIHVFLGLACWLRAGYQRREPCGKLEIETVCKFGTIVGSKSV